MSKVFKWLNHNRFTVITPIIASVLWAWVAGCSPETASILKPGEVVTSPQLAIELQEWQAMVSVQGARFEAAAADLEAQRERMSQVKETITQLASGSVADLPGLVSLLMGGGMLGLVVDNVRKGGVIGGLKRNRGEESG